MSTPDRTKLRRRVSLYHPDSLIPVRGTVLLALLDALDGADVTEAAFDGCEKVRLELKVKLDDCRAQRDQLQAVRDTLEGQFLAAETATRGYRERAERAEHELNRVAPILETARDHVRSGGSFCPTCEGAIRETDGMVCRFCGTDYATMQPRQYTIFSKPVTP